MVHGIIFTSWVLLFLTQASLVAAGRTSVHRRLGVAGAGLAAVMVVLGPVVAIPAGRRGALPGDPLAFLLVPLGDLVLFAVFVSAAIWNRRRAETHKRLMLLGLLSLLPPAVSRWPVAANRPAVTAGILFVMMMAPPVYDFVTRRRVNPITLWGGLALFVSAPLRFAFSQTEAWHRVARWLIS